MSPKILKKLKFNKEHLIKKGESVDINGKPRSTSRNYLYNVFPKEHERDE